VKRIVASSRGAIDLASIMVGIIVIGLVGAIVAATVFAVIPWTQDNAAKQQLNNIRVAQNAYAGFAASPDSSAALVASSAPNTVIAGNTPSYGSLKALVDKGLFTIDPASNSAIISSDGNLCVTTGTNSYRAEIKSASGNYFYSTDTKNPTQLDASQLDCLPPTTAPTTTYDANGNWTEGATINGVNKPVLFLGGFTVKTDSTQLVDWSVKLDRNTAPYSNITDGDVKAITGLPGWATITSDANTITISNNTPTMRVSKAAPVTIGQLRFTYQIPTWTAAQTTAGTPYGFTTAGSNAIQGSVDVSLNNTGETRYGYWSTDIDASTMKTAVGQAGTLSLTTAATNAGFTIAPKSGNTYTLTYAPSNAQEYMLKGKLSDHQSFSTDGIAHLTSMLVYTGSGAGAGTTYTSSDGLTKVTVSGVTKTSPPQLSTTFTTSKVGTWSVDITLTDLLNIDRTKTPKVDNGNFTLVKKSGDVYTMSFTGTWNSGSGQTTNTITLY
jgi:hypothetical protein